jgi:serine/threonine-protein kinase
MDASARSDAGAEATRPPVRGELIDGKYRVERELGRGGMGLVVSAWHVQLDRPVALKFVRPGASSLPGALERFEREARAAARLESEHVARVLDVGSSDEHGPFMVMEYLDGQDLGSLLRDGGPMPVPLALGFVLQACVAVAEAHASGIVHRDLKPANLFLARGADGTPLVKVFDFGLSKLAPRGERDGETTATGVQLVMGSFTYMAPEQVRTASTVDGRADIWSLGVVLHRLVSGRAPFEAQGWPEFIAMITGEPPTPLRAHLPGAPAELENVILRCLEKDRDRRFATVADLAAALAPLAPGSEALVESIRRIRVARPSRSSRPSLAEPDGETTVAEAPWGLARDAEATARMRAPPRSIADPVRSSADGLRATRATRARLLGILALGLLVGAGLAGGWRSSRVAPSLAQPFGPLIAGIAASTEPVSARALALGGPAAGALAAASAAAPRALPPSPPPSTSGLPPAARRERAPARPAARSERPPADPFSVQ